MDSMTYTPSNPLYSRITRDNCRQMARLAVSFRPPNTSHKEYPVRSADNCSVCLQISTLLRHKAHWCRTIFFWVIRSLFRHKAQHCHAICGDATNTITVLPWNSPGVARLDPHIMAHIFTIRCGLPSPSLAFESFLASG